MSKAAIIKEYLNRFKDIGKLTLAKKLNQDHPTVFTSVQATRNQIQEITGAAGKKSLKSKEYARPKGYAGQPIKLPTSREEVWTPVKIRGADNLLVLSDIHLPFHSKRALEASLRYGLDNGVNGIVLNGDSIDFPLLSKFNKDPRTRKTKKDIQDLANFMNTLNELFPGVPKWFKEGNHEERWTIYIWNNAPILWDFDHLRLDSALALAMDSKKRTLDIREFGWTYVDEGRPIMAGNLPILHGHELPKGLTNPVNMARGAYLRTSHTVMVGHGHRTSTHPEPDMFKNEVICWSTGCLCGLSPKWQRVNKWNHGFAHILLSGNKFDVNNLRISSKGSIRSS